MESLFDAAARHLNPADLPDGRRQLNALLEPYLASCRKIDRRREIVLGIALTFSAIFLLVWLYYQFLTLQPLPITFWASVVFGVVGLVALGWYNIMILPKAVELVPEVFHEAPPEKLAQFIALLVSAELTVFERPNRSLPTRLFETRWAPIFLSNHPHVHRLKHAIYAADYSIDWIVRREEVHSDPIHETKKTRKLDPKISKSLDRKNARTVDKLHWFHRRLQDEYEARKKFVIDRSEGRNTVRWETLFGVMEDFAEKDIRNPTDEPHLTIQRIVQETATRLKNKGERLGLHSNPTSTEWMEKTVGNGRTHKYCWIRRYITEVDFDPSELSKP